MRLKRQLIRTAICWVALSGWLLLVNPGRLPVFLLVVPFVLLYLALYELWISLAFAWQRFTRGKQRSEHDVRQTARFVGLFASFIVVLGSLGQLVLRDVVTLLLLFAVTYFYVVRGRKRGQPD